MTTTTKLRLSDVLTIRELYDAVGAPPHRIEHVIQTTPGCEPLGKIGNARIFDVGVVKLIRQRIEEIAAVRTHTTPRLK
jgi:hypothetical protein